MSDKTKEEREAAILARIYELDTETLSREQWEASRTSARVVMLTDIETVDDPFVRLETVLRITAKAIQLANTCNALEARAEKAENAPDGLRRQLTEARTIAENLNEEVRELGGNGTMMSWKKGRR